MDPLKIGLSARLLYPDPRRDFLPTKSAEEIEADLASEATSDGKRQLLGMLSRFVPRRLAEALLEQAGVSVELKAAELSKQLRRQLVDAIKRTRIPISGTRGYKKAEVTAGGVSPGAGSGDSTQRS